MRMTNEEYRRYAQRRAPRSPVKRNLFHAFWIGGLICCVGQFFLNLYTTVGLEPQAAGTAESITMVFIGAAAPALEFKTEGLITGTAAKMFVIAGPVIVYGISASVVYGLLLILLGLV